jgi:hypothetical protein
MSYTSYRNMEESIRKGENFTGNSARGEFSILDGYYRVYSYNTLIAWYKPYIRAGYSIKTRKYSNTTSRLQNIIRRALADMPEFEDGVN